MFLSYLAVGNAAFVLLFLLASLTAELVAAGPPRGRGGAPCRAGPVVVLVLDEFPLTTILRPDGTIDEARYPRTWPGSLRVDVVPQRLEPPPADQGVGALDPRGRSASTATCRPSTDHPRSYLYKLFGDRYPINTYEVVTDMLPPGLCGHDVGAGPARHCGTRSIVYGYRASPATSRRAAEHRPLVGRVRRDEAGGAADLLDQTVVGDDGYVARWTQPRPHDRGRAARRRRWRRRCRRSVPGRRSTSSTWRSPLPVGADAVGHEPHPVPPRPGGRPQDSRYEFLSVLRYQLQALPGRRADLSPSAR